jgi:hypothetical protein
MADVGKQVLGDSWPWPWAKPRSVYDTNGPAELTDLVILGVHLRVTPSGDTGVHTGRDRYVVACATCGTLDALSGSNMMLILHPCTTSPTSVARAHLREMHGIELVSS